MDMLLAPEDQEVVDEMVLTRMETFGETPEQAIAGVLLELDPEDVEF